MSSCSVKSRVIVCQIRKFKVVKWCHDGWPLEKTFEFTSLAYLKLLFY